MSSFQSSGGGDVGGVDESTLAIDASDVCVEVRRFRLQLLDMGELLPLYPL
jgi:hypothetical protein